MTGVGSDGRDCGHRTLQAAHDLLAAAWRYETSIRQLKLPLAETRNDAPCPNALAQLAAERAFWLD